MTGQEDRSYRYGIGTSTLVVPEPIEEGIILSAGFLERIATRLGCSVSDLPMNYQELRKLTAEEALREIAKISAPKAGELTIGDVRDLIRTRYDSSTVPTDEEMLEILKDKPNYPYCSCGHTPVWQAASRGIICSYCGEGEK